MLTPLGVALVSLMVLIFGLSSLASANASGGKPDVPGKKPEPTASASPEPTSQPTTAPTTEPTTGPSATPTESEPEGEPEPALVCVATGNSSSPYSAALFEASSIISGSGAVKSEGPANSSIGVYPDAGWGNIVPPVTHPNGEATFSGLNWGVDGQEIWNNQCGVDGSSPSESPSPPPTDDHEKVTVCLATDDSGNPYETGEFSATAIISGEGVIKSGGPADSVEGVYPTDQVWGNIVPPVKHPNGRATFDGLNWNGAGQQILEDECAYVAPTPSPSPTESPVTPPVSEPAAVNAPPVAAVTTDPEVLALEEVVTAPVGITEPLPGLSPTEDPSAVAVTAPMAGSTGTVAQVPSGVPAGGGALAASVSVQDQQRGAVLPSLLIVIGVAGLFLSALRLERLSRR
jgi:hypothetical protein